MAPDREYLMLELGQVLDYIGTFHTTRVQQVTFLGTINVLILGTALSTTKAGLFLVAAAVVAVASLGEARLRRQTIAATTRGILLQRHLSDGQRDTFLQNQPSSITLAALAIANEGLCGEKLARRLRCLPLSRNRWTDLMLVIAAAEASCALLAFTPAFGLF